MEVALECVVDDRAGQDWSSCGEDAVEDAVGAVADVALDVARS